MSELSKNELKVLAMLQGHSQLSGSYLKKNIFNGRRDRCEIAIDKLLKLGLICKVGVNNFAWTKQYP